MGFPSWCPAKKHLLSPKNCIYVLCNISTLGTKFPLMSCLLKLCFFDQIQLRFIVKRLRFNGKYRILVLVLVRLLLRLLLLLLLLTEEILKS